MLGTRATGLMVLEIAKMSVLQGTKAGEQGSQAPAQATESNARLNQWGVGEHARRQGAQRLGEDRLVRTPPLGGGNRRKKVPAGVCCRQSDGLELKFRGPVPQKSRPSLSVRHPLDVS